MSLEPIAIIGLGCRYPGANHPEAFWKLIQTGTDAVTEVPPDRWDVEQFYSPDLSAPGKTNTRWGGFLEQIDRFDPQFFGIAPREVASMDPQQRLLLEVAWEALEDGGQVPERLRGSETGVFIGIGTHDYSIMLWQQPVNDPYATMGTGHCIAANRISYLFDFKGPSLAIDTACSSSLVAVHLACQSLWTGESTLALAGGVNALILPTVTIGFSKGGFMSPSGRCKSFDASADGYVRSEGAGIVVLKPLSQAIADRDSIYAVIRGSAVNQDGFSQGMAAPNPKAQEAVLRSAYRRAGVNPAEVQYVEAHGTGTKLGDPIELQALGAVLTAGRDKNQPCAIGSVKSNIGHTETAAGVAGVIKVALMMRHAQIPPSLHFTTPNPQIPFDRLPLRIQTELTPWSSELPKLAGVNSFGFGGTNAHVVIEAAPSSTVQPSHSQSSPSLFQSGNQSMGDLGDIQNTQSPPILGDLGGVQNLATKPATPQLPDRPLHLFILSAKTEKALRELSDRHAQFIANHPDTDLADLCYTANARRSRFSHRLAIITASLPQLQQQLTAFAQQQTMQSSSPCGVIAGVTYSTAESASPTTFLFTGQGSQFVQMGRELYETEPVFREAIDRCDQLLQDELNGSLLALLYSEDSVKLIDQTAYTQPAIFALEYALAQLWLSWGIKPNAVMGHSVGEYVAACVAGVFCLEDGLKLIAARGRLMQALPPNGGMVSIAANESTVRSILASADSAQSDQSNQTVAIAAINGPQSTVISGEQEAIDLMAIECELQGIKTTRLKVSHAFHSPLMEPMIAQFREVASTIAYHPPQIAIVSNVTGEFISAEIATPEYWCQHIHQPVRFAAGLTTLYQYHHRTFLEIGAKPILCGMGRTCLPNDVKWLPSLDPRQSDWTVLLQSLGASDAIGLSINWAAVNQAEARQVLHLPTYPFQRQRYWWDEAMLPGTYQPQKIQASGDRSASLQGSGRPLNPPILGIQASGNRSASLQGSGRPLNPPILGDFECERNKVDSSENQEARTIDIQSHWLGSPQNWGAGGAEASHPLLGQLSSINPSEKRFTAAIAPNYPEYLQDHRVANQIIFPAAGYLEIALAAASRITSAESLCIESLAIEQPLIFSDGQTTIGTTIETIVRQDSSDDSFEIWSGNSGSQTGDRKRHARGKIRSIQQTQDDRSQSQELQQLQQQKGIAAADYYQQLQQQHLNYGRSFQAIQQIWQQNNLAWSQIQLPEGLDASSYCLHPVLWDACFQTVGAAVGQTESRTYLPVGIDRLIADRLIMDRSIAQLLGSSLNPPQVGDFEPKRNLLNSLRNPEVRATDTHTDRLGSPQNWGARGAVPPQNWGARGAVPPQNWGQKEEQWGTLFCRVELQKNHSTHTPFLKANLTLFNSIGKTIAAIEGLTLQAVGDAALQKLLQQREQPDESQNWLYEIVWRSQDYRKPEQTPTRQWIIFADDQGIGEKLAHLLKAQGDRFILVSVGDDYRQLAAHHYAIDPACPDQFQQLMAEVSAANPTAPLGIVHLWSLNRSRSAQSWLHTQAIGCGTVLNLLQVLSDLRSVRLWLITQAAQAIQQTLVQVDQTSLWGMARTMRLEHPQLGCTCVDLDEQPTEAMLAQLLTELRQPDSEDQIAYRQEQRYVARLMPFQPQRSHPLPFRLGIAEYGVLDHLKLMPMERRSPQKGEVEIQVTAAGVNFRDVLNALGMMQSVLQEMGFAEASTVPFGGDCVGRIVALGTGVRGLRLGDEVIVAQAAGSLAQFVTVKAQFVLPRSRRLSEAEAATLPTTFLTAEYGLRHLAKLKRGDRILIHAAAGGVGQAAIQIAQQVGATVFATASPGKWDFLRSLGVQHLFNSRTLDFAEAVMQLTEGQGVDVVLNSLNGEFINKSLSVLRSGGRFVEIGKLGIWTPEQMQQMRPDVAYFPFDLLTIGQENPAQIRSMLKSLLPKFESGKLKPLPHQVFPIEQAANAFRYMAQAKHIGKVVITLPTLSPGQPIVSPHCTYLITGGLGALGLKTAQGLIDRGATHLLLVGRKPPAPEAQQAIAQMQSSGANITIAQIDITQPQAIEQLLLPYQVNHPAPLRGIVHAAGVLDDGVLKNLSWNRFAGVMAPKVAGAWHLHQTSRSLSLDFFVCFSSIASLIGSPGQGSYAAANAAIDGLMQYRRQIGLPGLSINWGAWAESGMAAGLGERDRQRLVNQGMTLIPPDRGLLLLEMLLQAQVAQVGVFPVNWSAFLARQVNPSPFFQAFTPKITQTSSQTVTIASQSLSNPQSAGAKSENTLLASTVPSVFPRSLAQLQTHLQAELAKVLGFSTPDAIALSDNFADLGMDSLMAVEFNNRLQKTLSYTMSSSVLFDHATIAALAQYLMPLLPDNQANQEVSRSQDATLLSETGSLQNGSATATTDQNRSDNGAEKLKQIDSATIQRSIQTADQTEVRQAVNNSIDALDAPVSNPANAGSQNRVELHQPEQKSKNDESQSDTEIDAAVESLPAAFYQFAQTPEYLNLKNDLARVEQLGNPFFTEQEGIARDTTQINGRELISYASYNYIGMSGDPIVSQAAKAAIDRYGTSVSASRVVSGERPIHRQLEQGIARWLGTEDCIVYVGGHATNVTTIGHLFGSRDLILYDALSHNSLREGCNLSGATAIEFAHNDVKSLEQQLIQHRHRYEKVLIVVEGIYSTDGDLAPLPGIVALKQRFKAFLMVDEAHSIGVLGRRGGGIGEHFNIVPNTVDLWMGTLSKSFASCGGYIAGCKELIQYLKYTAPGFVFSVGISPGNTAAALAALQLLQAEPDRVTRLHQRSQLFLQLAKQNRLDTGASHSSPIIPVIVGEPYKAVQLSHLLADRGISVQPMVYPSVPYHASRLRFFITCLHSELQIRFTIDQLVEAIEHLSPTNPH